MRCVSLSTPNSSTAGLRRLRAGPPRALRCSLDRRVRRVRACQANARSCRARTGRPATASMTWPTQAHEVALRRTARLPDRPVESRTLRPGASRCTRILARRAEPADARAGRDGRYARWRRRDLRGPAGAPLAAAVVIVVPGLARHVDGRPLKLLPVVVMAHLLGGLLLFALLAYDGDCALRWPPAGTARDGAAAPTESSSRSACSRCRSRSAAGPVRTTPRSPAATISRNAWASWWPADRFPRGFVPWRRRVQLRRRRARHGARSARSSCASHRALLSVPRPSAPLPLAGAPAVRTARLARPVGTLLLLLQVALGIGNVVLGLPLALAIAHIPGWRRCCCGVRCWRVYERARRKGKTAGQRVKSVRYACP